MGQVELKNRFVKTASQTYFFDSGEHRISQLAKAFNEVLAKGGAGLVIVEIPAWNGLWRKRATRCSSSVR